MKKQHLFAAAVILVLNAGPAGAEGHTFPGKGESAKWDQANIHFNEGAVLFRANNYDKAIAKYQQAIAIYPYDYEYFNNLGLTYKKKNELDLALETLKKSIDLKPNVWESWSNLGSVYKHQNKSKEAVEAYTKALEYNPPLKKKVLLQQNISALKAAISAAPVPTTTAPSAASTPAAAPGTPAP